MKLNIKKGEELFSLPKSCIPLIADADAADLKVLLYVAMADSEGAEFDAKAAAEELFLSESEVKSSLKFWLGASVLKKSSRTKKEKSEEPAEKADSSSDSTEKKSVSRRALPDYSPVQFTANELCEIAEENADFKALIDEAQQTFGHMFNTQEITIIASLYANLMLSPEYILALLAYFRGQGKNLRYIEKAAYSFIDDGVDSAEALEEKLRALEKFEGFAGEIRRLFGLGVRSFIDRERNMLRTWLEEYHYGEDIVKQAYERTVKNTGKASLSYANSILKSWHEAGIKTVEDIEKLDTGVKSTAKKTAKTTRAGTATARSFDVDKALSKALERSYKGADK